MPRPGPEPVGFDAPPTPRPATAEDLLGPNLVLNPGAEEATPLDDGPADVAFPPWEPIGRVAIGSYEEDPVTPFAVADRPDLGRSYFLGGLTASPDRRRTHILGLPRL